MKPVALIGDFILDASGPGEVVLDSFAGSGTTLVTPSISAGSTGMLP